MPNSLRSRCIEAGARAVWDEWDSLADLEALDADGKANALADIEIVLDAMLDCLTENAEEWQGEIIGISHALAAPSKAELGRALAVLRNPE